MNLDLILSVELLSFSVLVDEICSRHPQPSPERRQLFQHWLSTIPVGTYLVYLGAYLSGHSSSKNVTMVGTFAEERQCQRYLFLCQQLFRRMETGDTFHLAKFRLGTYG